MHLIEAGHAIESLPSMSASIGSSISGLQPQRRHVSQGPWAVRPAPRSLVPFHREFLLPYPVFKPGNSTWSQTAALPASGDVAETGAAKSKAKFSGPAGKWKVPEIKEAHKVFDEVFIVVKGGDGGQGEIVESNRGRWVDNYKYKPGGNQPKKLWLPASTPADGADGADVVLVCDPTFDNLLHLHSRKQYNGPKGANGNPSAGSAGPKRNKDIKKAETAAFEIPVPPGTVVKRKSTGSLLGELINPGDRLLVAKGGRGGTGVVVPTRESNIQKRNQQFRKAEESGVEVVQVDDTNWKLDAQGMPGQQLGVTLLLRVVADVGIVGYPNAGKSSLLRSMTNATPDIAPYPFTTLMPNLGVLATGGDKQTVLADLPGLIDGAHQGKGLGRMFLRHLRRTNVLLHVVDASAPDPATDYLAVREELRMYNPDYCGRPHVVVLNKIDLLEGPDQVQAVVKAVLDTSVKHCSDWSQENVKPLVPAAIVAASAASGAGLGELNGALSTALKPDCTKKLATKGAAATLVLVPALLPTHDTAGEEGQAAHESDGGDEAPALQFYNSKVQGTDAWSGSRAVGDQAGTGSDEEGEGEELGEIDPADAWLFELSDGQLELLADQDDRRCKMREDAAWAAGQDPYGEWTDDGEPVLVNGTQESMDAASSAAAAAAAVVAAQTAAQAAGDAAAAVGDEAEEEEEDEWVELTQEELQLLQFLDEYEAGGGDVAQAGGEDKVVASDEDARLLALSDEELLAMADAAESSSAGAKGFSYVQSEDQGESVVEEEDGGEAQVAAVDPEDAWLFKLSDEELLALADKAEQGWDETSAATAAAAQGEQGGWIVEDQDGEQYELVMGPVDPEDAWLFELSDEELLALVEKSEQGWGEAPGVGAEVQGAGEEVQVEEDEGEVEIGPIDPEDAWMFELSDEELLALADKAEKSWEERLGQQ